MSSDCITIALLLLTTLNNGKQIDYGTKPYSYPHYRPYDFYVEDNRGRESCSLDLINILKETESDNEWRWGKV